jgi:serine/threonine protein kinase/Tfp pilus assembly protein PilF
MIGQKLGHFRIVEKLGAGGMGVVYRAHDEQLDRDVAIKVLPAGALSDETARKRFHQEALALSRLNHPNIGTVHEFGTEGEIVYLVMEYVAGSNLSDKLGGSPLEEKEILELGEQLAEGLAAAHAEGVVHRDLKPHNLRVTADGRLKILDFGLAKSLAHGDEMTVTGTRAEGQAAPGTLPYMAPEQLSAGATDTRSDLYSAGCILYEMATGQRIFPRDREPMRLLHAILYETPRPPTASNPHISAGLENIILKCLEKNPEHRYQAAKELLADLRRLSAGGTVAAKRKRRPAHLPWLVAVPALGVVLIIVFLFLPAGWRERLTGSQGASIRSLAVLPLENLSGDPAQEYFADGMTEELINDLSQVGELKVISRTSTARYKGTQKPLPQIANELHVAAVVEGSVLRADGRVRITVQLIEAATDRPILASKYERDLRDVLALQEEVARAITQEIQVRLNPEESARLVSARRVDPAAHEAYLKGRYFWNQRTREGVMKGLESFQQAIQIDPTYPLPYVGLADSYAVLSANEWVPSAQAVPEAKKAALKALELDGSLAEAHAALAKISEAEWDWPKAQTEYKRALELNPNYASAHQWYSIFLAQMGRPEEAETEARRATELNPLSAVVSMNEAQILYMSRRYAEARQAVLKTIELAPDFYGGRYYLGLIDFQTGKPEEGIAELKKAAELSVDNDLVEAMLGYGYGRWGKNEEARRALEDLQSKSKKRHISPELLAYIYVGMGKKDAGIQELEKAYRERDGSVAAIGIDPAFDPLRADPRFRELLVRMNLPAGNPPQ